MTLSPSLACSLLWGQLTLLSALPEPSFSRWEQLTLNSLNYFIAILAAMHLFVSSILCL